MYKRKSQTVWVRTIAIVMLLGVLSATPSAQTTNLSLLHAWTSFREPMVEQMLDEFTEHFPNITVEPRVIPNNQLHEQFTLAYAAGTPPDVVMVNTKHLVSLADQGVFMSLDEFIERDGIDWDIWVPSEINLGRFEGATYGLPIRTGGESGNILFYNKRLFAEGGLDPEQAPATFGDLLEFSKKLIRYDGDTIKLNPMNDLTQNAIVQPTLNWLYAGGGNFVSDDLRELQFNSPEAVDAFEFVRQFRNEVYLNPGDDNMGNEDFYNERSAMFFWGSQGFSYVWDKDPDFPLGAAPRPKNEDSQFIGTNSGTWHYAIPVTVEDQEAAWELLKWLTIREESAGWFIREQGRASPIREFNRHPDYFAVNPLTPVLGEVLEQVTHVPVLPIQDNVTVPLRDAFRKVLNDEAGAAGALQDALARSQAALDAYWQERENR